MAAKSAGRIPFLDIAKGILIALVVLGHANIKAEPMIYWFHMPAFFIISGFLLKTYDSVEDFFGWLKRKLGGIFIPYTAFYILTLATYYYVNKPGVDLALLRQDTHKFFYGGRMLAGIFWFVTCLFLSELILKGLLLIFQKRTVLILVIVMYLLAHVQSVFFIAGDYPDLPEDKNFFWNIDVTLITVPYMAFGYFARHWITVLLQRKKQQALLLAAAFGVVLIAASGPVSYRLDVKYSLYTHVLLDAVVPLLMTLSLFIFSHYLEKSRLADAISFIGQNSMMIMYLHIPLNLLFRHWFDYGPLLYFLIGMVLPLVFYRIIRKSRRLSFVFLGASLPVRRR